MARPREFDLDEALVKVLQVFWQNGYCATSLDDLETGMALKRQSIYGAFGDKRSLFLKTLKLYHEQGVTFVREQLHRFDSPKQAVYATLYLMAQGTVNNGEKCGCFMAKMAFELADHDPDVAAEVRSMSQRIEDLFAEIIRRGQACGEISNRQTSRTLAKFLISFINGLRVLEKTQPSASEVENLVTVALSVLEP
jgi:TetR/AcrR family transcriptional repressor of nem operon